MSGGDRRLIVDAPQELDGTRGCEPVSVLGTHVAVQSVLAVLQMKTADAEPSEVVVERLRSADDSQQQVRGDVVALRDREAQQNANRDLNIGLGVLILQRAVGCRQNTKIGRASCR